MNKKKKIIDRPVKLLRKFIDDLVAARLTPTEQEELLSILAYLPAYLRVLFSWKAPAAQLLSPAETPSDSPKSIRVFGNSPKLNFEIRSETLKLEPGFYRGTFNVTGSEKGYTLTMASGTRVMNTAEKS